MISETTSIHEDGVDGAKAVEKGYRLFHFGKGNNRLHGLVELLVSPRGNGAVLALALGQLARAHYPMRPLTL